MTPIHFKCRQFSKGTLDFSYEFIQLLQNDIGIYNAITLNKHKIDRVHKNELYIATVSIKQKAVDHIKTALRFWFNPTRISAQMT